MRTSVLAEKKTATIRPAAGRQCHATRRKPRHPRQRLVPFDIPLSSKAKQPDGRQRAPTLGGRRPAGRPNHSRRPFFHFQIHPVFSSVVYTCVCNKRSTRNIAYTFTTPRQPDCGADARPPETISFLFQPRGIRPVATTRQTISKRLGCAGHGGYQPEFKTIHRLVRNPEHG